MLLLKRLLLWFFGIAATALIAFSVGFHFWFLSFLQSERCRLWLNQTVSNVLHAPGEFMPLQATTGSLYTDSFAAQNGPLFRTLQADQLRAQVAFGWWARSCTVERLEMARMRVELGGSAQNAEIPSTADSRPGTAGAPGFGSFTQGSRFLLKQALVNDFEMVWTGGELKGIRLTAWPNTGEEWLFNAQDGALKFPDGTQAGQEWHVDSVDGRVHDGSLFITSAELRVGEHGRTHIEGEFKPGSGDPARCQVTFSKIAVGQWLVPDWRARLTGNLMGQLDFSIQMDGAHPSIQSAHGDVSLTDGELTALPALDQIAAVTHTDAFRRAKINKAGGKVSFSRGSTTSNDTWEVTQFTMESSGLLKVEGAFKLMAGQIDGTFQVGVAPATLQSVPGAKERIFTTFRDGYLWTPVRISGPWQHPSEDLTTRLAAAVVEQTAGDATQTVRDNAKGVLDVVTPLIPVKVPDLQSLPGLFR